LPFNTPHEVLLDKKYIAVIISGGPSSVYAIDSPEYDPKLFTSLNIPILGICYGMQLMAHDCGGKVSYNGI
jgi:GMP synthase (glutamine-hydrolysing)